MAGTLNKAVDRLRRLVGKGALAEQTDRQLLERFARTGDEVAFGALVQRHGPLVLGVCRRVLGHVQDAEDSFQGTFLVLARKAGQLAWEDSIKNWLHGVAYRVALKARAQGLRRKHKERSAGAPAPGALESSWEDLRSILDQELSALPPKYRAPLLLCYLEGKTRDEAAEELGWTSGSVKGRLERGRELLRARLLKRGLPLSAVLCASLLAETAATAAVPAALAGATIEAGLAFASGATGIVCSTAYHLAQGVLHAMLITKIKTAVFGTVLLAAFGLGSGFLVQEALAGKPAAPVVGASHPLVVFAQEREAAQRPKEGEEGRKKDGERKKDGDPRKEGDVRKDPPRKDAEVRKDREEGIRAYVKSIDIEKGTLTVLTGGDRNPTEHTYSLAGKDVKVTIIPSGQAAKLADLTAKTMVILLLNKQEDVTAIRAQAPTMGGVIAKVDADKSEITLGGERAASEAFSVAPDAKLQLNGREAKLDQYKAGTRVNLVLSLDRKMVLAMNTGGDERRDPGPREGARDGDVPRTLGVVIGVDAGKSRVEVLVGNEDDYAIRTLEITKDMPIQVRLDRNVKEIGIAELPKASKVSLTFSPDKKTVTRIEVLAPQVKTMVQEIDVQKRKITYNEKTLDIAADARIMLNRTDIPLTEINKGMRVMLVLNLERTQVIAIQAYRADGER